jgi:hypothetical protein
MWVESFIDQASGWTLWTSPLLAETEPRAEEDHPGARQRPAGQGLLLRLLGRVGAWFGICEQTPSGAWHRLRAARRDPWEPGARRSHSTVWSWWCP